MRAWYVDLCLRMEWESFLEGEMGRILELGYWLFGLWLFGWRSVLRRTEFVRVGKLAVGFLLSALKSGFKVLC